MNVRIHVVWLGLLLVSCEKPRKPAAAVTETEKPRITKSHRPAGVEAPPQRDRLRAAFQQAAETGPPEARDRALAAAVWDALELEPDLARDGLQRITPGTDEKNRLIEHFAMRMAEQSPEDAVSWAHSLATDEEKSLAFGRIALVLSESDPERAATILSDSGVAGRDFDVAVVQVIQRWAAESPAAAAAWVMAFDAGEARSAGMREIVSVWIGNDSQAAFAWISTILNPELRQEAELGAAQFILEEPDSMLLESASPEIQRAFEKLKAEAREEN